MLPASGLPDTAATLRTIDLVRGIIARRPPLAPPAPGPNLVSDKPLSYMQCKRNMCIISTAYQYKATIIS